LLPPRLRPRSLAKKAPAPILRSAMYATEEALRELRDLEQLARACGVTTSYHDGTGQFRRAGTEAVVAVLAALGAPLTRIDDAPGALRELTEARATAGLAPVLCVRPGRAAAVPIGHLAVDQRTRVLLTLESGEQHELTVHAEERRAVLEAGPGELAAGYHTLSVESGGRRQEALVLAAPAELPRPARHALALFAPLYALHSERTRELADYGELTRLARLAADLGADYAATLPLLDVFADTPFDPSPYAPISRRFWNELYIDVEAAARLTGAVTSGALTARDGRGRARDRADAGGELDLRDAADRSDRPARRVDYRAAAGARRRQLEKSLAALERRGGAGLEAFEHALADDPGLADYAAFRATVEKQGCTWPQWPACARAGRLGAGDFDHGAMRVHAYAQWLARAQVKSASNAGAALYLDFPLGSHAEGYDTWRDRDSFALGIGVGAPADALFTGGQNWGFPPLHPQRQRRSGYALLRAALRHHFEVAGLLRIDHVMGIHRLFWIAEGCSGTDGVYVHYPAEEIWSVVAIEAARAGAAVVGEDLGTVADEVRREMEERGALRMFVVPFEVRADCDPALPEPPPALACLGTHDTATFAAWWDDLGESRRALLAFLNTRGLLDHQSETPQVEPRRVLEALLTWLASSQAAVVLVALEDLALEREPQNRPGTPAWAGNWVQRTAASLEDVEADAGLRTLMARLAFARRQRAGDGNG